MKRGRIAFACLAFLLAISTSAFAATLCSFAGPESSNLSLSLSDFSVTGPANLTEGDVVSVSFTLSNGNRYSSVQLGNKGVFAAATSPSGKDASFGFSHAGETISPGNSVSFASRLTLNQSGTWTIWPSFLLGGGSSATGAYYAIGEVTLGPDKWHACSLQVSKKAQNETPSAPPSQPPTQPVSGIAQASAVTVMLPGASGSTFNKTIVKPSKQVVIAGAIFIDAYGDDDDDGVINGIDECPDTPAGEPVFENGCRCKSDNPSNDRYYRTTIYYKEMVPDLLNGNWNTKNGSKYKVTNYFVQQECDSSDWVNLMRCNPLYENGSSDEPTDILWTYCSMGCKEGKCVRPYACATKGGGTCSDGIQNQDETGVDCGGKCPPCGTKCSTGAKYAPQDTPCTSYYPNDQFYANLTWPEAGELNHVCNWYEVCHPKLDRIIEEAVKCCSVTSAAELDAIGNLSEEQYCSKVLKLSGDNCQKCTGMYIIKGLGNGARWMKGYNELTNNYTNPIATAERLIDVYGTGVCRDYALEVTTLLRKAGYKQNDVGSFCDGAHCYNVVRFPGDAKWTVVDTTGNAYDVNPGGIPQSGYPYCDAMNESNWCFLVGKGSSAYYTGMVPDTDAYWSIVGNGGTYNYTPKSYCKYWRDFPPASGPGMVGGRDSYRIPDFAPSIKDIAGCG